ncbi:MAG TPA: hypothetical protein VGK73_31645 [Polyangiaceae bacterium]
MSNREALSELASFFKSMKDSVEKFYASLEMEVPELCVSEDDGYMIRSRPDDLVADITLFGWWKWSDDSDDLDGPERMEWTAAISLYKEHFMEGDVDCISGHDLDRLVVRLRQAIRAASIASSFRRDMPHMELGWRMLSFGNYAMSLDGIISMMESATDADVESAYESARSAGYPDQ